MTDPVTVIQVSDTHLSETHAWFTANWPVFLGEVERLRPDVVVHSGDVSFNGPDNPADLVFARGCLGRLPVPWMAIAGNHDVGEAPVASRLNQPINDIRLANWRAQFGSSWWVRDLDKGASRLRLVGLDTALMGSDHPDEVRQAAFLEHVLAERDGRAVVVFVHMPPFDDDPDDERPSTHCILPGPRRWLLDRCLRGGVAAIAAGHIHRYASVDFRGMAVVAAPGTSFVNLPAVPPHGWRRPRTGYLAWTYDGHGLRHELVAPPLFMTIDASNWTESHVQPTTTNLPPRPLAAFAGLSVPVG